MRPEQPSPNMLTGVPILAQSQPPGPGYPAFPQNMAMQVAQCQGGYLPHHAPFTPRVAMVAPNMVGGPMAIMQNSPMSSHENTISPASSLPSAFHVSWFK